jgi:hypothetical protein
MDVRAWWDNAREGNQTAVLSRLKLDRELAGIPWALLSEEVQSILVQRVRIKVEQLDPHWKRT